MDYDSNETASLEQGRTLGVQCLVSALVSEDFDVRDAIGLGQALVFGEFDALERTTWADIPPQLREWLRNQDGLKIDGAPISSEKALVRYMRATYISPKCLHDYMQAQLHR
ncbi:hypothetical protein CC79DRAFT_1318408 [Sarocladium strictum]